MALLNCFDRDLRVIITSLVGNRSAKHLMKLLLKGEDYYAFFLLCLGACGGE
jgi:molybdopterin-binding protein